jgi:hypothetical protein
MIRMSVSTEETLRCVIFQGDCAATALISFANGTVVQLTTTVPAELAAERTEKVSASTGRVRLITQVNGVSNELLGCG